MYFLSSLAKAFVKFYFSQINRSNSWLIGGSISELSDDGHVFNTSLVFDKHGDLIDSHRKVHLFDIDIPGKMTFKESEILSAGNKITVFDSPWGKIGLAICYDVRFPEMFQLMRDQGAKIIVIPAAFNSTTGPLHWELLMRARAVDTQSYILACAPARSSELEAYPSHGHTMCVNPWGEVQQIDHFNPAEMIVDLDLNSCEEVRSNIPVGKQRRHDLYNLSKV